MEVLGFIIGLITNDTGELGHSDMSIFGLELMYTALNGGQKGESCIAHILRFLGDLKVWRWKLQELLLYWLGVLL